VRGSGSSRNLGKQAKGAEQPGDSDPANTALNALIARKRAKLAKLDEAAEENRAELIDVLLSRCGLVE
jgi:hypothetical protein